MRKYLEQHGVYLRFASRTYGLCWMTDLSRLMGDAWTPNVIFDVGANVGQTAIELARRWKNSHIHSFEPVQSTFQKLRENTAHLPAVHCHNLALGDKETTATIQAFPLSTRNSLRLENATPPGQSPATEEIQIATLDTFIAGAGLTSIDILKTDTEGFDLQVLQGASQSLQRGAITCVYVEVSFLSHATQQTPFPAINAFLNDHHMECVGIYDTKTLRPRRWGSFCNALFLPRAIVDKCRST